MRKVGFKNKVTRLRDELLATRNYSFINRSVKT